MKKLTFIIVGVVLILGCAATYKPPIISAPKVEMDFTEGKSELFSAVKRALIMEGYQIINSDREAGIISTAPKLVKFDETYCDCGTTMGLAYIKDKRTITKVSFGVLVFDRKIKPKATIEGEYLKRHNVAGVTMVCVSTGKLENELIAKIKASVTK